VCACTGAPPKANPAAARQFCDLVPLNAIASRHAYCRSFHFIHSIKMGTESIKMDSYQKTSSPERQRPESSQLDVEHGVAVSGDPDVSLRSRRPRFERSYAEKSLYNWKTHAPTPNRPVSFMKWLVEGVSAKKETDEELHQNLAGVARLLILLREYQDRFGMPEEGGPRDQEFVLQELCTDLYAGGSPIWALEPVMKKVAEGLTGKRGVDFFFLPRKAFIFAPTSGATFMFAWNRGFRICVLEAMERVAVRLASFASNTNSISSLPSRLPHKSELRNAYRGESMANFSDEEEDYNQEELAEEILDLASESEGLFFFLNSRSGSKDSSASLPPSAAGDATESATNTLAETAAPDADEFWNVDDSIRELFSRLATIEAIKSVDKIDHDKTVLYSPYVVMFFRVASSAGACAMWFNGSWYDMLVAGVLAVFVALIGSSTFLSRHDRLIFEVIASFIVGLVCGLIALTWEKETCFGAMAIAGVLDILQGFRVVYSIIEIMSKHTVTGGADFIEGILFTGLIAYSLKFGQYAASSLRLDDPAGAVFPECLPWPDHGINPYWYFLFVPLAALSWSGLFEPDYVDLPMMAFHGVLGYTVSWAIAQGSLSSNFNNFMAALIVTFSAGIVSRFTGRQALGNTVSGLYVLLPGAYLVNEVFANKMSGFLESIILRAVIIGLGSWTGTLLCSPTLFGTNRGLLQQSGSFRGSSHARRKRKTGNKGAMLFF